MAKTNNDFLMANYDYDNDYVSPESALYSEDPNTGHPNLENIQVPKILYVFMSRKGPEVGQGMLDFLEDLS